MKSRILLVSIFAFSLFFPVNSDGHNNQPPTIKVMTINLLFSEIEDRDERLDKISEFVRDNNIDIILLQEVVGGYLSGTFNSSWDLQGKLAEMGAYYDLSYRLANGLSGLLAVGNAILVKGNILFTLAKTLPVESEEVFKGLEINLSRKAMMSRLYLQDFGIIDVYNTHLCAFCEPGSREEQAEALMNFVHLVDGLLWGKYFPAILGGDFNTQYGSGVYNRITQDFIDTYADKNNCSYCCPGGCTYAVNNNPYASKNPFTREPAKSTRIDYIFSKNLSVEDSEVVFIGPYAVDDPFDEPENNFVSDHSAVVTVLALNF